MTHTHAGRAINASHRSRPGGLHDASGSPANSRRLDPINLRLTEGLAACQRRGPTVGEVVGQALGQPVSLGLAEVGQAGAASIAADDAGDVAVRLGVRMLVSSAMNAPLGCYAVIRVGVGYRSIRCRSGSARLA
jgi:hypothetical protein